MQTSMYINNSVIMPNGTMSSPVFSGGIPLAGSNYYDNQPGYPFDAPSLTNSSQLGLPMFFNLPSPALSPVPSAPIPLPTSNPHVFAYQFIQPGCVVSQPVSEGVFRFRAAKQPPVVEKRDQIRRQQERSRNKCTNEAFNKLRSKIPSVSDVRNLSKIKTLRLATQYIKYLNDLLETDEPLTDPNSRSPTCDSYIARVEEELSRKNWYGERAKRLLEESAEDQISPPTSPPMKRPFHTDISPPMTQKSRAPVRSTPTCDK